MSRKIIHLTDDYSEQKVAVHANHIIAVNETSRNEKGCTIFLAQGSSGVLESYETVLRLWADALASED